MKSSLLVKHQPVNRTMHDSLRAIYRNWHRWQTRHDYSADFAPAFKPYRVNYPNAFKRRAKVLHAIANFITGGSSRLVVDLVEHLSDEFEQEIITAYKPHPPAYIGIKVHEYPPLSKYEEIVRRIQTYKPAIIHVHYWGVGDFDWYDLVFRAADELGIPIIENINTPVDPYLTRNVRKYVFVSKYVRQNFGSIEILEKSSVIYPGSNFDLFARRENSAVPDDCIGMVYRLDRDKLNAQSIDVFIKVIQRRPRTKALIVGGGYYLEAYREAVRKVGLEDAFEFPGYVSYDQLPVYYERMSVFVAPVYKESFGQVSPFAMSMEIPVSGYQVGALEEIIGYSDLLASPGNSEQLADIIVGLLDDRKRRLYLGKANRLRSHEMFSVQSMTVRYRELYRHIVSQEAKDRYV